MFDIALGDTVVSKKNHPCGGNICQCVRCGADIKLKCLTCGRIIMLDREDCMKRTKKIIKAEEK